MPSLRPPRSADTVAEETERATQYIDYVSPATSTAAYDRVIERRRAVALARHFREAEGFSIKQIADRLGRSPATVKAYFYDPSDVSKRPTRSPRPKAWAVCLAPPAGLVC